MIRISTKLTVKELAGELGKGRGYVYKMRQAGFAMEWDEKSRCLVTTEHEARLWVRTAKFRVVKGVPLADSPAPATPRV